MSDIYCADDLNIHQERGKIILMNKQEFLDRLRVSLNGRISAIEVEDTIQYYRDYIDSEIRKGKSEDEVLNMLGDPRLIARTIIETSQPAEDAGDTRSAGGTNSYQSGGAYHNSYREESQKKPKIFRMPGWLLSILVILVVYLILSVVFSVLAFLAPVIIVVAVVLFMVKLFRDWLN